MHVRSGPGTKSLSVMGSFGKLYLRCWWDANAHDEELVKEWVGEIAGALKHYLGGEEQTSGGLYEARL